MHNRPVPIHVLVNPAAASGRATKTWVKLQKELRENDISYQAHIPAEKEEMASLVRRLTSGEEECHLLVMGGDGTVNLAMQNIVNLEKTVLSYIPTGSGNDFARGMRISKNPEKCIQRLQAGEELTLDYGSVTWSNDKEAETSRRFLISSGIGYDADVCEEVNRSVLKKLLNKIGLGKISYLLIALKQVITRTCPSATVIIDGEKHLQIPALFLNVVMLQPYEGGGAPFCPKANPFDGLFDVCLVKRVSIPVILTAIMLVYMKKHYIFKAISGFRCKQIAISLNEPQWMHYDGEVPGRVSEIRWECYSGLRFI